MKKFIIPALAFAPTLVFAQNLTGLDTLVQSIGRLVRLALPVVVGIALLAFFWGLAKFIFQQGNEEQKTEAKKIMIWAVVAFFVMVSVWGLVGFLQRAFGINPTSTPGQLPTVPGLP
jgi:hypothetical protein